MNVGTDVDIAEKRLQSDLFFEKKTGALPERFALESIFSELISELKRSQRKVAPKPKKNESPGVCINNELFPALEDVKNAIAHLSVVTGVREKLAPKKSGAL